MSPEGGGRMNVYDRITAAAAVNEHNIRKSNRHESVCERWNRKIKKNNVKGKTKWATTCQTRRLQCAFRKTLENIFVYARTRLYMCMNIWRIDAHPLCRVARQNELA